LRLFYRKSGTSRDFSHHPRGEVDFVRGVEDMRREPGAGGHGAQQDNDGKKRGNSILHRLLLMPMCRQGRNQTSRISYSLDSLHRAQALGDEPIGRRDCNL
jgi:hypothetical protein